MFRLRSCHRFHQSGWSTTRTTRCQLFRPSSSASLWDDAERNRLVALLCKVVPQVQEARAHMIVDALGPDTQKIVFEDTDISRLAKVKGLGKKVAKNIKNELTELENKNPGFIQLSLLIGPMEHVTTFLIKNILKAYGKTAAEKVKKNPYKLINVLPAFGFKRADRIALQLGHARDSDFRIAAGIRHLLLKDNKGNTAFPINDLRYYLEKLLSDDGISWTESKVLNDDGTSWIIPLQSNLFHRLGALISSSGENEILRIDSQGESFVQHKFYADAERKIAASVRRIQNSMSALSTNDVQKCFKQARAARANSSFTEEQWNAVQTALTNKISILDGGAGTGKTSLQRLLVDILEASDHEVTLLTPTGRAADRLSKATNINASTIHRAIKLSFDKDSDAPGMAESSLSADFVIIDESSMLDTLVASETFGAIKDTAHILFVGDKNQLESVSAGSILRDLIALKSIPVSRLSCCFRQGNSGSAAAFATEVLNKTSRLPRKLPGTSDLCVGEDCGLIIALDQEACLQTAIEVKRKILSLYPELDPLENLQVLSPTRKGKAGVETLNLRLQEEFNKTNASSEPPHNHGFRIGDKVMQTVNHYNKMLSTESASAGAAAATENASFEKIAIFNGNIGKVVKVSESHVFVNFDGKIVEYKAMSEAKGELELAYALTIHKSQGSEYDVVIVVIPKGSVFLSQKMIYTAVTRGRKVVLVGDPETLDRALNRRDRSRVTLQQYYAKLMKS